MDNCKKSVIIIGAGISGLNAALNLLDSNLFNIKILEATSDYGGRIKKFEGFADIPIEFGAEEIHGEKNEYSKEVLKNNFETNQSQLNVKKLIEYNDVLMEKKELNKIDPKVLNFYKDLIEKGSKYEDFSVFYKNNYIF